MGDKPLPTVGTSSWRVRVDESGGNAGDLLIGVCDEARRRAWGLRLCNGRLYRFHRRGAGSVPDNYPDGHFTQVLKKADGERDDLYGRANGAIIEVRVDHDEDTLSYSINDGRQSSR